MARSSVSPRRSARFSTIAVVSALLLAACGGGEDDEADEAGGGGDGGGEPVEIEFWGWVPGLEDAVAAWNAENPDIQVNFHRMTGDDGAKIPPAIDAGTAPDVFQIGSAGIPEQIVAGRLMDISEYVADIEGAFDETAWSLMAFAGAKYGIPQDAGPSGMMYRSDLFEQYGIAVPETFEQYLDAGRALKAADPDIYLAQLSPNEAGFWMQQVWQAGGSYVGIEDDSWTVEVDNAASQEVAELWQTALDEGLFKVVEMWTPEYWAEVNAGHIATINYLAWFPALLEENAGDLAGKWRVTHSPRIGGRETAGNGGVGANVIPHNTEHAEEAVAFAKWLNTSEEGLTHLIEGGGIFPAALAGLEHPSLRAPSDYFGGQVINEVFLAEATLAPSTFVFGPSHNLTQESLKDQFARVANGEITFSEALTEVADATRQALSDAGLSVK